MSKLSDVLFAADHRRISVRRERAGDVLVGHSSIGADDRALDIAEDGVECDEGRALVAR